jgi:hypothetical protein
MTDVRRRAQLVRHGRDERVLDPIDLPRLRHFAQRPDPAQIRAVAGDDGLREALEHALAVEELELVRAGDVGRGCELAHAPLEPLAIDDRVRDREQPLVHRPGGGESQLLGEREQGPVADCEAPAAVG